MSTGLIGILNQIGQFENEYIHSNADVSNGEVIIPLKLKHKIDRYVRYGNNVNVVLFAITSNG